MSANLRTTILVATMFAFVTSMFLSTGELSSTMFAPISSSRIERGLAVPECRSKYLAIKTSLEAIPDPRVVVDFIRRPKADGGLGQPSAAVVWANHPAETGGHPHTHYIVRFPDQVYWGSLRAWLQQPARDPHSYSDVGRSWTRSVRYLLHLDNAEKEPIPRENLKWVGLDKSEIEVLLGAPRQSLLNDIRSAHCPRSPFGFVNWLVNERGHTPGEVASMIRCVLAASEYVARIAELEHFRTGEGGVDDLGAAIDAAGAIPEGLHGGIDAEPVDDDSSPGLDLFGMPEGWA